MFVHVLLLYLIDTLIRPFLWTKIIFRRKTTKLITHIESINGQNLRRGLCDAVNLTSLILDHHYNRQQLRKSHRVTFI